MIGSGSAAGAGGAGLLMTFALDVNRACGGGSFQPGPDEVGGK